ncbi:ornithine cyclodeaminase [Blastococcus saxobsidens]|uniref:Ornithine cyclodeaminase n=1 Tax=Blastococcus saxobsidens (strain DD2) TaxID=1146883 RepID=H6RQJ6_BLASD|nr:ornithine cyclodeaminase [Blastococcus saxobsidens]CCG05364.1 Ornithine cyclodeaminase [Blastococcus saxobsidens DD2]
MIEQDTTRVRVVSAEEVERFGGSRLALGAARTAARVVREPGSEVRRMNFRLPGGWMRILGAALPSIGVFGYKEFHYSPGGTLRYAIHLFSTEDGRPLGIVDAALITTLRTAAAATAAATAFYDGRTEPLTVGVIGSGAEAQAGLRALASALPVAEARVSSRNEVNRQAFADRMSAELGIPVIPVAEGAAAAVGADAAYLATNSGGKVVAGLEILAGVPLVLSIGSTMPDQRELHADVLAKADVLVIDTPDVLEESGDALDALGGGLDPARALLLGDYLGAAPASGSTVYKSIGSPEQDIVLAWEIVSLLEDQQHPGRVIDSLTDIKRNL